MLSLKESIFGKKIEEKELKDIEPMDVKEEPEDTEEEDESNEVEDSEETSEDEEIEGQEISREELMEEIQEALEDLTDDELDVVLDAIYSLLLADEEEKESEPDLKESLIDHQTPTEKTSLKMKRRLPKWKRKAKIRYFRNKKCPTGTSWSSKTKSCTHINIDMSRLQKIIAKMKIRSK